MTDSDPPPATPLALPPATLNAPCRAPHPDSEEAVQSNRHRIAQELDTIHLDGPRTAGNCSLPSPTIRARGSRSSGGGLQRHNSRASTATDTVGNGGGDERSLRLSRRAQHWHDPVVKFWTTQVSITIEDGDPRDYLALERTFLAYLRTSLALAMTGIVVAQLFRLQHSINPNPELGFFVIGVPLAAVFIGSGMVILLIGAFRFWRQQQAMIRGKVYAGGWELSGIMLLSILICTALFALVTAVDVEKSLR
ncbi:hypothetical protein K458DRAFT_444171 [Lentithecium fluviatile CBS 122367]|uniref:DUF202 domain-containing protein n=1 Tax=Lentithecium fluviatile CBS 122367 TaxID=1168545 RepID=A0A6G1IWP9_9PLEO|nr:hypothetical protein K458DRAFT_444171 [Lentithecium fluviatile CBS 122367]